MIDILSLKVEEIVAKIKDAQLTSVEVCQKYIERINEFGFNIKNNKLPKGVAIDDGVAVVFIDGKPTEVYSSRKNHTAYFLDKDKKINLTEYIKNL